MLMEAVEIATPNELTVKYVSGAFVGIGQFALKDCQDKTEVVFSWHTSANTLTFKAIACIFPVRYIHWLIVDRVLRKLERYVSERGGS